MNIPCIFNCSNDMALATNARQYLPPKRIQQMEVDLADLAYVWEGTQFAGPWGWSLATKQRYKQMGVPEELLPSDEWLEEVRRLSSREYSCFYLKQLLGTLHDVNLLGWGMKFQKTLSPFMEEREPSLMPFIFKSLWSSSGRGVFVSDTFDVPTLQRLQGFISSQGGYVVDEYYENKVLDFAMEFFIHPNHQVEFLGYSVFVASAHGAYGYNYVESQADLLRRIDVDEKLLQQFIDFHKVYLSKLAYHGPVGVDMLKTADGSIHPCLELNLRMNMGILALLLYEQYGAHATIALTPEREKGFQAVLSEGRLMIVYRS